MFRLGQSICLLGIDAECKIKEYPAYTNALIFPESALQSHQYAKKKISAGSLRVASTNDN